MDGAAPIGYFEIDPQLKHEGKIKFTIFYFEKLKFCFALYFVSLSSKI